MTGTSCRNVQAAAASRRSKQKTTLKHSPGHLPGTPWGCGLSALAMAAMSSCCQQTSATPSIRESAAARSASCPFAKRRSTSIPSFAASGLIVSSGRRLLLPPWPAAISALLAGADAKMAVGFGNTALLAERRGEEFGPNPRPLPAARRQRILVRHANGIDPAVPAGFRLVGVSYDQDGLARHFLRTYAAESCRPRTRLMRAKLKR